MTTASLGPFGLKRQTSLQDAADIRFEPNLPQSLRKKGSARPREGACNFQVRVWRRGPAHPEFGAGHRRCALPRGGSGAARGAPGRDDK